MKCKYKHWCIAYRTSEDKNFEVIKNPKWAWCADPFLVKFQGEIYLFAEAFLYKTERKGLIVYAKFENGKFGNWQVTMDKHWHISYPNVFVYENNLYMCPETYQKEEVALYKLVSFPDHWERVSVLVDNMKCVDTTFLRDGGEIYMYTFEPTFHGSEGSLYIYKYNNGEFSEKKKVCDDLRYARPAGNMIWKDGKRYRVAQNCEREYGSGITIMEVESVWPEYREKQIVKIFPYDIKLNKMKRYCGIHTYNTFENIEVVDLKYEKSSVIEYFAKRRVRKVFVNKYR